MPVATGFKPSGAKLTVNIGGYQSTITLGAKGTGSSGTASIKLTGKLSKAGAYTSTSVKYTYAVKNASLFANLQSFGFTNATVKKQSVSMTIIMDLAGNGYIAPVTMTYSATKGKTGKGAGK